MSRFSAHKLNPVRDIRILLVDDHLDDALHTQAILKECRLSNVFDVVHLQDGELAMNYVHQAEDISNSERPALVLLDLDMPRLYGRAVLKRLEADESLREVPVIVLTDEQVSDQDRELIECSHAHCYLHKPLDLVHFIQAVTRISSFGFNIVKNEDAADN